MLESDHKDLTKANEEIKNLKEQLDATLNQFSELQSSQKKEFNTLKEEKRLLLNAIQQLEKELEDIKTSELSARQTLEQLQKQHLELQTQKIDLESNLVNSDQGSYLFKRMSSHHQKAEEKWANMEESIIKASRRLFSLQERHHKLQKPFEGVLKVLQRAQVLGRKIIASEGKILAGETPEDP